MLNFQQKCYIWPVKQDKLSAKATAALYQCTVDDSGCRWLVSYLEIAAAISLLDLFLAANYITLQHQLINRNKSKFHHICVETL